MTGALFSANAELVQLPLQDAEVYDMRQFLPEEKSQTLMRHLVEEVPWRAEKRLCLNFSLARYSAMLLP